MVVKEKRGRRRYIAFMVVSDFQLSKQELVSKIRERSMELDLKPPSLIQFEGKVGIVRCSHLEKDRTIELLGDIGVKGNKAFHVETLRTSGTLRTLREIYFKDEVDH